MQIDPTMSESSSCDVVVVGGGIAGLTAANRAAQQGLKVVLVERGADESYLCNSCYSEGIIHVAFRNVKDRPQALVEKNGACAGIVVSNAQGTHHFNARAVILADGSFHKYIAIYHLDAAEICASRIWKDAVATPWTAKIIPRTSVHLRLPMRRYQRRA